MNQSSNVYRGIDYTRHKDFFSPNEHGNNPVFIIGAGAIGSFVALTLAKIGFGNITVFDFDKIDAVNIPNQFYPLDSIGRSKVEVLKEEVDRYAGVEIKTVEERFLDQEIPEKCIMIATVDSMLAREIIFSSCVKRGMQNITGMIDSRMAGTVYRVYTINHLNQRDYMSSWYPDSEAVQERCTSKSVIFNVCGIASIVCSQAVKLAKNEEFEFEIYGDFKWHVHQATIATDHAKELVNT